MKKILSFFTAIKDKLFKGGEANWFQKLFSPIKKLYSKDQEKTFVRGLMMGLIPAVILLIVILGALYWTGVLGDKKVTGPEPVKVKVTIVTKKDCPNCWDTKLFLDAVTRQNLKITSKKTVYADKGLLGLKSEGEKMVEQYKITKLPTIILEADFDKNKELVSFLTPALGEIIDGKFVLRQVIPPYYDVASGQIKGGVNITYLTDQSCKECYDVKLHDRALTNLGVPTTGIKIIDVSSDEGKQLVSKYSIKLVPTLILSGEVSEYQTLVQVWKDVGTVTSDGTYIFTDLGVMGGSYKDLSKNQIIKAPAPTAQTAQ